MRVSKVLGGLSIGKKLAATQLGVVLATFVLFIVFVSSFVGRQFDRRIMNQLDNNLQLAMSMIDAYNLELKSKTKVVFNVLQMQFSGDFSLDRSNTVLVNGIDTPIMRDGGTVLNLNFSAVDYCTKATGATATVFARKGDDFVRVTTSLKQQDGSRAVGTFLGKSHPAHARLMAGQGYIGNAKLFGKDYITEYEPIKGAGGEVIGVLYVGLDFTDGLMMLKEKIRTIKIGETGYLFAINAKEGPDKGMMNVHPNREGEKMWEEQDADGKMYVQEIVNSKNGTIRYRYKAKGEAAAQDKVVVFKSYGDWGWVICGGSNYAELARDTAQLRNYLVLASIVMVGVIAVLLALVTNLWVTKPLENINLVARDLAEGEGDLTKRLQIRSNDELGELAGSLNKFIEGLHGIISNISDATTHITDSVMKLAASSEEMVSGAEQQTTETAQVTTAMEEMSATVQEVAKSASTVSENAKQAGDTAVKGGEVVSQTVNGMMRITQSVRSLQPVILELSRGSEKIGDIVRVIDDVADQTNLLALNAAIEAARAGEQGRGFAVVADEVRKLAERTTASTKEIAIMVKSIQEGTTKAVSSMETSATDVESGVNLAGKAGDSLTAILASSRRVQDMVQQIATSAEEQSAAAEQITSNVESIATVSKQNALSAKQTQALTREIDALTSRLKGLVGRFKVQ